MQILVEFYANRPPAIQLEIASKETEQERYRNTALLTLVPAVLVCPLFPLTVIALWNVFMPRRLRTKTRHMLSESLDGALRTSDNRIKHTGGGGAAERSDQVVIIDVENGSASVRCASNAWTHVVCQLIGARGMRFACSSVVTPLFLVRLGCRTDSLH